MPNELLLTAEMAIAARPCRDYPHERVREIVADGLAVHQIARLGIPLMDRWWALTQTGLLPENLLRYIAARVARSALTRERRAGREPDSRSWEAVKIAEQFACGSATRDDLAAARASARASARDAAWDAAWDVALAAQASAWERHLRIAERAIAKWQREGRM